MTDQNSQFFAILTAVGRAKQANADALGVPWTFAQMGVGDANDTDPIPSEQQTQLINERRRAPLNQLKVDPTNPNIIIAEQVIPENIGGWWIREVGLYDADGDLVAVANCAPSYKPLLTQGSGRTQVVRMNLIVSNTANVELKIDPSVVLATRQYVDSRVLEELHKLDSKQSVRVATTANIVLSGLLVIDGITLLAGDRVLVKNQTAAKDNGIYIAASTAWKRAPDVDTNAEVTSAMILSVEQGTAQADTRWQLVTDGAIVLGTTALTFQNVTQGFAPLNSPALIGAPTAPTVVGTDSSTKLATSAAVRAIMAQFGLGSTSATLLNDFKAINPGGLYLAYGALVPNLATPNAPPESDNKVLAVLAVAPRPDCMHYLAFETGTSSSNRSYWVGQYTLPAGTMYWSRLLSSDQIATQPQVDEGALDNVVVTPKKMRWGVSYSLGQNGYLFLPSWLGGICIQWGYEVTNATGTTHSFPIAFPSSVFQIIGSDRGVITLETIALEVANLTQYRARSSGATPGFAYVAIGR